MKRRNVENGKIRRPMKSKKASEGTYSSWFGYIKFLLVWFLVLLADFILEFRFEYLYPVWLLIKSAQDSYKYQGLLLTMLFVMAALGADVLCYIFIPVQWLFFAASGYVWVQYVWHTDRGLCLSSVVLWLIFVYVEASLRPRDSKVPRAFNMDLTRPFAAHCIGYPVVTLGYGIKTAATESLRRRTRRNVKKSNLFYQQLLQEALPIELQESKLTDDLSEDVTASSECVSKSDGKGADSSDSCSESSEAGNSVESNGTPRSTVLTDKIASTTNGLANGNHHTDHNKSVQFIEDFDVNAENEARELHRRNVNDLNEEAENLLNNTRSKKVPNKEPVSSKKVGSRKARGSSTSSGSTLSSTTPSTTSSPLPVRNELKLSSNTDNSNVKADFICRLESDIKKLKADLQASRNTESELRSQLNSKSIEERQKKQTVAQLQQDNDNLQNKLHNIVVSRQQDKQNLAALEKKLQEEKKLREKSESQLANERKSKKEEEQVAARAVALAAANSKGDACSGDCKAKMKELEENNSKLKWEGNRKEEQIRHLVTENSDLRRSCQEKHSHINQEMVKSAVSGYQMRIAELQSSLSTETKMKIELYQALGDYKRQSEMQTQIMAAKDLEIAGLRSHIADALALVPSSMYTDQSLMSGQYTTPKLGTPTGTTSPTQALFLSHPEGQPMVVPQHPQHCSVQPAHSSHPLISTSFSPVQVQMNARPEASPTRSCNGDVDSPPLNPQAKDYLPGTPTTQ